MYVAMKRRKSHVAEPGHAFPDRVCTRANNLLCKCYTMLLISVRVLLTLCICQSGLGLLCICCDLDAAHPFRNDSRTTHEPSTHNEEDSIRKSRINEDARDKIEWHPIHIVESGTHVLGRVQCLQGPNARQIQSQTHLRPKRYVEVGGRL
eukprot:6982903-Prymnesium_polylepis.2